MNPIVTLIRNTRLLFRNSPTDVRIVDGRIEAIGPDLATTVETSVVDAGGGSLLPGLHDHHLHLMALAAAMDSLRCGPPDIVTGEQLAHSLRLQNAADTGWLRGIGYHPCVAGEIDRHWLDRHIPDRPVRIQHRGGRLWVVNSAALERLGLPAADQPDGVEMVGGGATGRLYECDQWLRNRLGGTWRDLAAVSDRLAGCGITGITDTSPRNGPDEWACFRRSQESGALKQRVRMMGSHRIGHCEETPLLHRGEFKIHLLESRLPDLEAVQQDIGKAHGAGRSVAIHCVTRTELVFALGALGAAGVRTGDRIEHASVTPPELLAMIREMGLRVVTQPHFIAERGDQYMVDVDPEDRPWLYRCAGFLNEHVPLAAGSDAPFGDADPWAAMRAAVRRQTASGVTVAAGERLTPEQALALYLSDPAAPGIGTREVKVGSGADLCLLDVPWRQVRNDLSSRHVRYVWRGGEVIFCGSRRMSDV